MLFPCPKQVNNSFVPTRVFNRFQIKTVAFQMILVCDVGLYLELPKVQIVKMMSSPADKFAINFLISQPKHELVF